MNKPAEKTHSKTDERHEKPHAAHAKAEPAKATEKAAHAPEKTAEKAATGKRSSTRPYPRTGLREVTLPKGKGDPTQERDGAVGQLRVELAALPSDGREYEIREYGVKDHRGEVSACALVLLKSPADAQVGEWCRAASISTSEGKRKTCFNDQTWEKDAFEGPDGETVEYWERTE